MGRKDIIPKGIGTGIWSWTDDRVKLHTNKFNNLLHFTSSPIDILSKILLVEYMKGDEVTWVLTKSKFHILFGILEGQKYNSSLSQNGLRVW